MVTSDLGRGKAKLEDVFTIKSTETPTCHRYTHIIQNYKPHRQSTNNGERSNVDVTHRLEKSRTGVYRMIQGYVMYI